MPCGAIASVIVVSCALAGCDREVRLPPLQEVPQQVAAPVGIDGEPAPGLSRGLALVERVAGGSVGVVDVPPRHP